MLVRARSFAMGMVLSAPLLGGQAFAESSAGDLGLHQLNELLDIVWVLVAASLVFLMQIGFLLLEAGMVRSKNSINVALKNVLDFLFSVLAFAIVGFMFAFGPSLPLLPGFDMNLMLLSGADSSTLVFFIFQAMFCGTAATIVSGAVAERMKLSAYALGSIIIGALIYPVFVQWTWGAGLSENPGAFLGNMGFIDFAGSTVVHATGAWLALAACMTLGARRGRFDEHGRPVRFAGHSPVLAASGALLLYVGWIGFNGGSTVAATTSLGQIIANTILAGAAGGAVGMGLTMYRDRVILPEKVLCGLIGGLVAVTAGCNVLDTPGALLVGAAGGLAAVWGNAWLERSLKIDDAVGAIGVHGFAGVTGTLLLALLAPAANLPLPRAEQFAVQALGSGLNFIWAFGVGYAFFYLLKRLIGVRVSGEAEDRGLNESEHSTRIGVGHIEDALGALANGTADLGLRLPVENGDEAERLTRTFNALIENMQRQELSQTELREMTRSSEEAERLSALADATFEGLCLSVNGVILDGNAALGRLFGVELSSLRGQELSAYVPVEHRGILGADTGAELAHSREICVRDIHGSLIPVEVRGRDIIFRGQRTRVLAIVDLRERKEAEARIRHGALHDHLTGLPNRALFNERLQDMIDRTVTDGMLSAVILIDLDRFKDINDLHGHAAGDEVLKATADRLRSVLGPYDTAARLGGDEFAILQIDIHFINQAADLAMRLITELNKPIALSDGHRVKVGASIGLAICPRDGIEDVRLVTRADTALYHAKSKGRNCYAVFEEGMDENVRKRQLLELDLANAIERDQFELHFQPRMSLSDGEIGSYEALVRWRHPERGLVSPAEFIPVAEGSGRIVKIGEWVLRRACFAAARSLNGARVSVNASPLQFRDRNFIDTVKAALKDSGLPPGNLEIEITENVLIDDDERALAMFHQLKRIGVKIALDDFGTGYSSLSYLSRFAFDAIKIDRSFVTGLSTECSSLAIIETIVRLGRALDMTIVAEGVESLDELGLLASRGCDEVQGFLIGKPSPIEALVTVAPGEVSDVLHAEQSLASLKRLADPARADAA